MPRIRTIKPEFPQSESMGRISREARLCFILLWTIADDEGRLRASSRMLASLLYPYDDDAPGLMNGWLNELEKEGCIRRYRNGDTTYCEIIKWLNHQKIDRPSPSRLPKFDESSRVLDEHSSTDLGPRTLDQDLGKDLGKGVEEDADAANLKLAVQMYNQLADEKGLPKAQVLTASRKTSMRKRLVEAGGIDGWAYAISQIRESAFLTGKNDRGWKANLDFMLQQKSFTKIMEGSYTNGKANKWQDFVGNTDGRF